MLCRGAVNVCNGDANIYFLWRFLASMLSNMV